MDGAVWLTVKCYLTYSITLRLTWKNKFVWRGRGSGEIRFLRPCMPCIRFTWLLYVNCYYCRVPVHFVNIFLKYNFRPDNVPEQYEDGYCKLRSWTYSSLDLYKVSSGVRLITFLLRYIILLMNWRIVAICKDWICM